MAKIKNTENTENSVVSENTVETPVEKNTKEANGELDDRVRAILKCFTDMEKVYVDSYGGVYGVQTEKHLLGDAVLYKNPYYKLK